MDHKIIGGMGGGKGGSPHVATEAANTLQSKQVAHLIDLISEGEVEGLIDGPAGIYLDDVQLFTPTTPTNDVLSFAAIDETDTTPGTWNFKGVSIEYRAGTQSQSAFTGGGNITSASTVLVNVKVLKATPVVRSVTDLAIDQCLVTISVGGLSEQNPENGDLNGSSVEYKVEAKTSAGSWVLIKQERLEGKCMSAYAKDILVDFKTIGVGPWDLRVTRISDDAPTSNITNDLYFQSLTAQNTERFRYPNSAAVSIGIDSSQFSRIATRSYDMKLLRVKVPSNYNPVTRVYTGIWDGTYVIAWTDNPVWCFNDILENNRYGLGEYIDTTIINKWALYTISQYCDQLVPDGLGGMEPRFTCNVYFQESAEAITFVQNFASMFRSLVYFTSGGVTPVQDAPANPVYTFTNANVENGNFEYTGGAAAARHSVALVTWNNPKNGYRQEIEYVDDDAALLKFGYRPVQIVAIGCTSQGQARRMGKWALYVEQFESDIVSFVTGLEGAPVYPGAIVQIMDTTRSGDRMGGRVMSVAGLVIGLDAPMTLPAGTHNFYFIADDGSLVQRTTTVAGGTYSSLTISAGAETPSVQTIFGVETSIVQPQLFRLISITEDDKKYKCIGIAYSPGKWAYVENNLQIQARSESSIKLVLPAVSNVQFFENLFLSTGEMLGIRLAVTWDQLAFARHYLVSYRRGYENWSPEVDCVQNNFVVPLAIEGWTYTFRITPVSIVGQRGNSSEIQYVVIGEKAPPAPFDFFKVAVQPDGTREFTYGYTTTVKPLDYKGARIKYYQGVTADVNIMTPLENEGFFAQSPVETNTLLAGTYTFAIQAEDRTKHLSTPIFIQETLPARRMGNIFDEFFEDGEGWTGTKTSCQVVGGVIEAIDSTTWATAPATWALFTRWVTTPTSPITYTGPVRDFGTSIAGLYDSSIDADGTISEQIRTSADNISWSAWGSASSPFTARYLQARLTITATGPSPVPTIRTWSYKVSADLTREYLNDIVLSSLTGAYRIGVGDIRIPCVNTYTVIKRIGITIQDNTGGDWTYVKFDASLSPSPRMQFKRNGVLTDPQFVDFYIEGYA